MEDDDILTEDIVTLTRGQWEDLMRSIQSLSLANAKLVETIAFLLKQNLKKNAEVHLAEVKMTDSSDSKDFDPYDLTALRRLMDEG